VATSHRICKPAYSVSVPSQDKFERVAAETAFGIKVGDDGGGDTDSLDGVASRWIVGASASVIFPCTIESRRW